MAKRKLTKTARRLSNFFHRLGLYAESGSVIQDAARGYSVAYYRYCRDFYKTAWRNAGWLDGGSHPLDGRSPSKGGQGFCSASVWAYIDADIERNNQ